MIIDHIHADDNNVSTPMKGVPDNTFCQSHITGLLSKLCTNPTMQQVNC